MDFAAGVLEYFQQQLHNVLTATGNVIDFPTVIRFDKQLVLFFI